ncbi:beta-galactoside-binding lectin-like [Brachyhypopomus gauderio]|uniref:beta-galactoside-binding lectin-like n=1 Tax=Brachyhypopomus gauderio TaxID=698409 RepID=UPI0040413707
MVFTVKDMTFKAGQELSISGKVKSECDLFSINIGHDEDNIALHFCPRFCHDGDTNVIVCNSNQGAWGEEQREHSFPFQHGEEFKVTINFNNDQFYIKLPNGTMMSFPNRYGDDAFKHFDVRGEVKVQGIKIK